MAKFILFHSHIIIVILLYTNLASSRIQGTEVGISIDLIHRDSPHSPLYKPHETTLMRYNNAFRRAFSRFGRLYNRGNIAQSDVSSDDGEYLMKFSIGTPPVDVYGIADTGSDLTWTQCLPCEQCYKQVKPLYNPSTSSSYRQLSCQSQNCHLLDSAFCTDKQICNYTYGYGDNSLTKGVLSTETISFGSSSSFQNIVFGCGHNNTGTFNENQMGLVGLGGRGLSFVSQINSQLGKNTFSYCLVPFRTNPNITSKFNFGDGGRFSGPGVVSTPLVSKQDKTYYYVTLQGFGVGNKFIPYTLSQEVAKGNMFIDTGTPPTLIPRDFYNRLEEKVKKQIKLQPYRDPKLGTQLCYESGQNIDWRPILTAHFDGGVVPLDSKSTFIASPVNNVFCFAMNPVDADVGVFGNFAQSDIQIGYDLEHQVVSFMPTDCTKQH